MLHLTTILANSVPEKSKSFEIEVKNKIIKTGDTIIDWDLYKISDKQFHAIYQNKSFLLTVISADWQNKTCTIKINQHIFEVKIQEEIDLLLQSMGMNSLKNNKVNEIKAPMPGLILDIKVEEGQAIQKGDTLLILEAMKMENILKAPNEGVVKTIIAKKGTNVEKNQILIVLQ